MSAAKSCFRRISRGYWLLWPAFRVPVIGLGALYLAIAPVAPAFRRRSLRNKTSSEGGPRWRRIAAKGVS